MHTCFHHRPHRRLPATVDERGRPVAREGAPSNLAPRSCAGFRGVWTVRPRRRPLQRAFVATAFAAAFCSTPRNPAQSAGLDWTARLRAPRAGSRRVGRLSQQRQRTQRGTEIPYGICSSSREWLLRIAATPATARGRSRSTAGEASARGELIANVGVVRHPRHADGG